MYLAIRKTLDTPSLFRNFASHSARHTATVKRSLECRRPFSTTTSVAEDAKTTTSSHTQNGKEHGESTVTKEQTTEESTASNLDPDTRLQPKLNPWIDFFRQYVIKHREPGVTSAKYAADASRIWRSMSAEEKAECIPLLPSTDAYGAPEAEIKAYNEYIKTVPRPKRIRNALVKDSDGQVLGAKRRTTLPKLTAREVALRAENLENYDKNSPLSVLERGAELSKRWNELGEEEREVYKQRVVVMYKETGS